MNYRQLLVLPIPAMLGPNSVEPAKAHDFRQTDTVTQVITEVKLPRGTIVQVTQYSDAEAVEVTVNCVIGIASFNFKNGDSLEWLRTSMAEENQWTATWKNGRSFASNEPPSVYDFACHTH